MSDLEPANIKDLISIATPFIKGLIDSVLKPKFKSLKSQFELDYKKNYVPIEESFSEYLHRTYKRVSIVNTLVFNNSQRVLKEIYIPLTLVNESVKDTDKYTINGFPFVLVEQFEKILITDNAGMGKSTLVKKIFLDCIDEKLFIPLLIELRRLSKGRKIIDEIKEQIDSIHKAFPNDLFFELLVDGGFFNFFRWI